MKSAILICISSASSKNKERKKSIERTEKIEQEICFITLGDPFSLLNKFSCSNFENENSSVFLFYFLSTNAAFIF